jgi:hypothetical protein
LDSKPLSNLCLLGIASDVAGDNPWVWSCTTETDTAYCASLCKPVNGTCSKEIGKCRSGEAGEISYSQNPVQVPTPCPFGSGASMTNQNCTKLVYIASWKCAGLCEGKEAKCTGHSLTKN